MVDAEFRFRRALQEANGVLPAPILEEVADLELVKGKKPPNPRGVLKLMGIWHRPLRSLLKGKVTRKSKK